MLERTTLLAAPSRRYRAWELSQRSLALLLLLAVTPMLLVCGLLVRLTSPGPVMFSQTRQGLGGRRIYVRKLRTMTVGADRDPSRQFVVAKSDPAVTPVGAILRALKLDELPQLWSVATGEMALVGPRPIADALDAHLRQAIPGFERRYDVRPGLTSLGQVCSFDNFPRERLVEDWSFRFACEADYIRNRCVRYDLLVLGMTVLCLLRKAASTAFRAGRETATSVPA